MAPRGHYAIITASHGNTVAVDRLIRRHIDWNAWATMSLKPKPDSQA